MRINIQGTSVPALGFGTWQLSGNAAVTAIEQALAIGYRHLDTAQMYRNENEVGRALQQSGVARETIFLTTKIWPSDLEPARVRRTTEESLRKLQTEYVDLLLIHWPSGKVPLEKTLEAMFELQAQDKTRHVGVSNFPPGLLEEATQVGPIFCNQVEYHPFLSQQRLLEICRAKDILLTAYSPLALGKVNQEAALREIGEKYGKTPSQVTLRWLVQQDHVAAIPKASKPEHMQSNFEISNFTLSLEEMKRIDGLSRNERLVNPDIAPQWDR